MGKGKKVVLKADLQCEEKGEDQGEGKDNESRENQVDNQAEGGKLT